MPCDIIFVDTNTIWHRRLATALAGQTHVVALEPKSDPLMRTSGPAMGAGNLPTLSVGLPPGWASRTAPLAQLLLSLHVRRLARTLSNPVLILSSPAYEPLTRRLSGLLPIVTYTSDDYGSYAGWSNARQREKSMQSRALLNVYVSESLRNRAIDEDGVNEANTFVSQNATEHRFGPQGVGPRPPILDGCARPVLGVLGGLSDRLDLTLIERAIGLEGVGTFLVAGPVPDAVRAAIPALNDPRVRITGRIPHEDMHRYAHALDAALIPYAPSPLNHNCSPMRLYDHLATGVKIFALPGCDQINTCGADGVVIAEREALLRHIAEGLDGRRFDRGSLPLYWDGRSAALLRVLDRNVLRTHGEIQ